MKENQCTKNLLQRVTVAFCNVAKGNAVAKDNNLAGKTGAFLKRRKNGFYPIHAGE